MILHNFINAETISVKWENKKMTPAYFFEGSALLC